MEQLRDQRNSQVRLGGCGVRARGRVPGRLLYNSNDALEAAANKYVEVKITLCLFPFCILYSWFCFSRSFAFDFVVVVAISIFQPGGARGSRNWGGGGAPGQLDAKRPAG